MNYQDLNNVLTALLIRRPSRPFLASEWIDAVETTLRNTEWDCGQELLAFRLSGDDLSPVLSVEGIVVESASMCWRCMGGPVNPIRAAQVLSIGRSELKRAVWCSLLIGATSSDEDKLDWCLDSKTVLSELETAISLGDQFAADQFPPFIAVAEELFFWLAQSGPSVDALNSVQCFNRDSARPLASEVLAAAALSCIDHSCVVTGSQVSLLAQAGQLLRYSGLECGVETIELERRDQLRRAGARGATTKHSPTNALKAWAIAEAGKLRGDDMSIAKRLASRVPAELASVSKDPRRLIYDALRRSRVDTSG